MRPIMLHGHERSVTQIKYNREGDLIFSAAKDPQPNVWYSLNGERLGSFKGHTGAVWCIDVSWDTKNVATGSADNSCRLWDCETGRLLTTLEARNAVRTVGFSFSGKYLMYSTDITMGAQCEIRIVDTYDSAQMKQGAEPGLKMTVPGSKVTSALWEPYEKYIVSGHESGELCQFDVRNSEKLHSITEHTKQINDLQLSKDGTMVITASKDTTAKLFDLESLKHLKTYKTDRPVNSAAISPTRDHVVLGGGQEARDVTTTNVRTGKFDAKFFHLIYEEEFAQVKGHFGPINSVAFHPDGNGYSSGGEDGYVRVHQFDPSYLEYDL